MRSALTRMERAGFDDALSASRAFIAFQVLGVRVAAVDFGWSVYAERNNGTNRMIRAGGASVAGTAGAMVGFQYGASVCKQFGPAAIGYGVIGGLAGGVGGKELFEETYDYVGPIAQSWWEDVGFMDFRSIRPGG